MKFGSTDHPGTLDLSLPEDHPGTEKILSKKGGSGTPDVSVGCAKWGRSDLKDFYPRGTGDELEYYSSQFNCVELNATYYNYSTEQIQKWHEKVPEDFKFFPKIYRYISHLKWLSDIEEQTEDFIDSIVHFEGNLGTTFLQLRDKFRPKFFDRVAAFVEHWPDGMPLAIELRHPDWFDDEKVADELYELFEENDVSNVITDTAAHRDLLHMRLTNNEAFIRYVGANHPTDVSRLDEWVPRLKKWNEQGLTNIHFFVHQNEERKSPQLAAYFIKKVNESLGVDLKIPSTGDDDGQGGLF